MDHGLGDKRHTGCEALFILSAQGLLAQQRRRG